LKFFIPEDLSNIKSGKHKFLKQLRDALIDRGLVFKRSKPDIVLHLGRAYEGFIGKSKTVCRLDGLEFNVKKSYKKQNKKVIKSIRDSSAVVFQNRFCAEAYFRFLKLDKQMHYACILNGALLERGIEEEPSCVIANCKWRPHKRLKDIIDCFLIAKDRGFPLDLMITGDVKRKVKNKGIKYPGWLSGKRLKRAISKSLFGMHLAWIDWCPNSVVEYICNNKPVIYTNSGGTKYIVKGNGVSIGDIDWNFNPLDLYSPPKINKEEVVDAMFLLLEKKMIIKNSHIDIYNIASEYKSFFEEVLSK